MFDQALEFALRHHSGIFRKSSKVPYVLHVTEVAKRALEYRIDVGMTEDEFASACVLHDVVEDCGITYEQLISNFNKPVADVVMEVSFVGKHSAKEKFEHFQKLKSKSHASIVLKVADRISNIVDFYNHELVHKINDSSYAAKYALLGMPIFQASTLNGLINMIIVKELCEIDKVIKDKYYDFSSCLAEQEFSYEDFLKFEKNRK